MATKWRLLASLAATAIAAAGLATVGAVPAQAVGGALGSPAGGGGYGSSYSVDPTGPGFGDSDLPLGPGEVTISWDIAAPTVTSISPTTGVGNGGTPVTSTSFLAGTTVSIGGTVCTSPVVGSITTITCTIGAHAVGAADVAVTNYDTQIGTLASGFTYTSALLAQVGGRAR